jgi:hypothetical protein
MTIDIRWKKRGMPVCIGFIGLKAQFSGDLKNNNEKFRFQKSEHSWPA